MFDIGNQSHRHGMPFQRFMLCTCCDHHHGAAAKCKFAELTSISNPLLVRHRPFLRC